MFMTAAGVAMILATAGCGDGRKVPENSLAFEDVVYVEDEYPVTRELAHGDTLDLPVLGVSDFVIKDSLLIVSNNDNSGRVTVLSLDGRTVYGKFLRERARRDRELLRGEQHAVQPSGRTSDCQLGRLYR